MVTVVARWKIQPDKVDFVRKEFEALMTATRAEPGCLIYDPYWAGTDQLLIFERYKDEAAVQAHWNSPHFLEIAKGKLIPCLVSREVDKF